MPSDLEKRVRDVLEPYLLGGELDNVTVVSDPPDVSVKFHSKSPVFNGMRLSYLTSEFSKKVLDRTWQGRMGQSLDGYGRDPGDNEMVPIGSTYVELYVIHGHKENSELR